MRQEVALAIAAGAAGVVPLARTEAATMQYGGFVDLHAGYGSNPFFDINSPGASAFGGVTGFASATRLTARARTVATGQVSLDQYQRHYGGIQNYAATLRHNQQLSQKLALSGGVEYENAVNPSPSFSTKSSDLLPQGDLLTVGQRTQRISGNGDITWEPDERNLWQAGINASHASFSSGIANSYDSYGASIGYLHTFSARTKIGLQGGANFVRSSRNPDSSSFTLGLQIVQQISAVWKFDGGVSLLTQKQQGQFFKTPGFNGSLCGTYPRLTVCFVGSRLTAPSGIGGLRTDTQGGVRVNYKLTERSTVDVSGTYDISSSQRGGLPTQKYYELASNYRRELTPRLSVGVSGRIQGRDYGSLFAATLGRQNVTGYTVTGNVVWKFGRIS